jgi:hypothetical protein
VVQNPLRREVNVMFLFDGANATTSSFANRATFEYAVQTGIVPQDYLLVGITDWQFAIAGDLCPRNYEYSFSVCDPAIFDDCPTGCNTGGTDKLLLFLNETVLPMLLSTINMDLGEVSVVGGSMGGLTSCYAVAKDPTFYQRGICFSPTPWNTGQLASVVTSSLSGRPKSELPKAVVMYISSCDANAQIGTSSTGYTPNGVLFKQVADAFLAAGMNMLIPSTMSMPANATYYYPTEMLSTPTENVLTATIQFGGLHTTQTWEQYFSNALQFAFRPDFNANFTRLQKNDFARSLLIPPSVSSDDDEVPAMYEQATIGLSAALGVTLIAFVAAIVYIVRLKNYVATLESKIKSASGNEGMSVANPINKA